MATRRTLAQTLFHITKISSPTLNLNLTTHAPFSSLLHPNPSQKTFKREYLTAPVPGEIGFSRRFLKERAIVHSEMSTTKLWSLPIDDKLVEKLTGMDISRDRLRLDELMTPLAKKSDYPERLSIEDARKLLRLSQLETLKSKLRLIPNSHISYSEFVQICLDGSSPDQGLEFSKMLDDSGAVIVLGNDVFLRPEQVAKVIEKAIPLSIASPDDPRRKDLEKMEKEKLEIDEKAEVLVRRELWCGLGFFMLQTFGFMRLTFWELSWDVMEPICFYITSIYFMAGYAFFLRTSRDPSFEGFFENRFRAKQKQLMKIKKFDMERFNQLRRECYRNYSSLQVASSSLSFIVS